MSGVLKASVSTKSIDEGTDHGYQVRLLDSYKREVVSKVVVGTHFPHATSDQAQHTSLKPSPDSVCAR